MKKQFGIKSSSFLSILIIITFGFISISDSLAQTGSLVQTGALENAQIEQEKLKIEREKLKLEKDKVVEQQWATGLTILTIVVTALIGSGTIIYNIYNSNRQAKIQARLKAIEVVVSAAGPKSAKERLLIVNQLLDNEFIDPKITENLVAHGVGQGHDQSRKELIKMLLEFPNQRDEIFKLWEIAFGETGLKSNIDKMRETLALNTQNQNKLPIKQTDKLEEGEVRVPEQKT